MVLRIIDLEKEGGWWLGSKLSIRLVVVPSNSSYNEGSDFRNLGILLAKRRLNGMGYSEVDLL